MSFTHLIITRNNYGDYMSKLFEFIAVNFDIVYGNLRPIRYANDLSYFLPILNILSWNIF